jgi:hypothetical protein
LQKRMASPVQKFGFRMVGVRVKVELMFQPL